MTGFSCFFCAFAGFLVHSVLLTVEYMQDKCEEMRLVHAEKSKVRAEFVEGVRQGRRRRSRHRAVGSCLGQ